MVPKRSLSLSREEFLGIIVLICVTGSFVLAIMDRQSRPQFIDLTKFAVGTYVGLLIPRPGTGNHKKLQETDSGDR